MHAVLCINQHTKFEVSSCTKSNDMVVAKFERNKIGHVTLTIGADLPGAVGADAPIDGRSMGAMHP